MKKSSNWKLEKYQGWDNYYTWNIALWLNNDYGIYSAIQAWKKSVNEHKSGYKKNYKNMLLKTGLYYVPCTGDGVSFHNSNIKRREIINAIFEE